MASFRMDGGRRQPANTSGDRFRHLRYMLSVWLVLALGCAGGSSFELTRATAPMRWVVEGWPWPVSYGTHIAVDLCNGGPRPPTKCLSGSLVRSLPHTLKRDAPLFLPLPCMHARKSNHGGQPRRTLGPTRTSSTRVRVLTLVACRLRDRIPLQQVKTLQGS